MQHFGGSYRQQIAEQAALFTKPELKEESQCCCYWAMSEGFVLLKRCGEVLQMARKVGADGYFFKKGHVQKYTDSLMLRQHRKGPSMTKKHEMNA